MLLLDDTDVQMDKRTDRQTPDIFIDPAVHSISLQCFDAVGWAAGRASPIQPVKKLSGVVLAWLSVGSKVQTCI